MRIKEWPFDDARIVTARAVAYDTQMAQYERDCEAAEQRGRELPSMPSLKEPERPPGFHYHGSDDQGRPRLFEVHAEGARRDDVVKALEQHVAAYKKPPPPTMVPQAAAHSAQEW